jgi:hypothetical protein
MAITVNWRTKVITVPVDFLTPLNAESPPTFYELDVNALRLALKDIEDSEGMPFVDTHRHNSTVILSGVAYARTFEIINGYTILFDESVQDHYSVSCVGANHNVADVKIINTVSLIIGNSAGLIVTSNADDLLDAPDSIEPGMTLRQALRLIAAASGGKLSGADTSTVTIRNAVADTTDRVVATVDQFGNRSAVTTNLD